MVTCACQACTIAHGDASKGTYTYATVGGDAKGLAQTASGITAESLDTSTAFREINKTGRFAIGAAAASGIASDLAGSWKSVTNAKTSASASKAAASEATKQAGITAEVEKLRILNPTP